MHLWYMTFTTGMNVLVGAVYFSGNMIFLNSWTIWTIQWSKNKQATKKQQQTNKKNKRNRHTKKEQSQNENFKIKWKVFPDKRLLAIMLFKVYIYWNNHQNLQVSITEAYLGCFQISMIKLSVKTVFTC